MADPGAGHFFFLSSLKVIPSVMMERRLNFKPVVTTDVVEALLLNGALIYFVFHNFGIWSYVFAVMIKSVVGVVVMYSLAPIRLGIGIDRAAAKNY